MNVQGRGYGERGGDAQLQRQPGGDVCRQQTEEQIGVFWYFQSFS